MKIIHTSDWHLGHRLYNYDGSDEELHFFTQLAATVEKEQPDALLVSGDIFDTGAPGNDVAKRFTDALLDVTTRCAGMETFIILSMPQFLTASYSSSLSLTELAHPPKYSSEP